MGELDCGAPIIVDQLRLIELHEPAAAAVDDRPISLRLLHEDPASGEEHYLVRYPTGVRARLHRHAAAHTMVVLDGQLEVNGRGAREARRSGRPDDREALAIGCRGQAFVERDEWERTRRVLGGDDGGSELLCVGGAQRMDAEQPDRRLADQRAFPGASIRRDPRCLLGPAPCVGTRERAATARKPG